MIKTILPSSFGYQDRLSSLVDVHKNGIDSAWMRKAAAAGVFKDADIKPEKGQSYIHLIAMGDSETYGCNRNGDLFKKQAGYEDIPRPEDKKTRRLWISKGNRETHQTFETGAKVYRNHQNKDPKQAHGDVVKSAHNDTMNRVELIIRVPDVTWGDELEKLASGGDVPFSMSCKIPYDFCSECGHQARTRRAYCGHLKNHMSEITKEGNQIGAINDGMVYFDISKVVVPADRIAFGLLKAASDTSRVVGGAELAEQLFPLDMDSDDSLLLGGSRLDKLAMLRKLSEIEKEVECNAGSRDSLAFDPEVYGDMPEQDVKGLSGARGCVGDVLGALADVKISLSLSDFLKIILGSRYSEVSDHVGMAKDMLPGIFGRLVKSPASLTSGFDNFDLSDGIIPRHMREIISKLVAGHSLDDDPVRRRVTITVLRGKSPLPLKPAEQEKKSGAASALAERLAIAYAMYKIAFCQRVGEADRVLAERAVLQHYI